MGKGEVNPVSDSLAAQSVPLSPSFPAHAVSHGRHGWAGPTEGRPGADE